MLSIFLLGESTFCVTTTVDFIDRTKSFRQPSMKGADDGVKHHSIFRTCYCALAESACLVRRVTRVISDIINLNLIHSEQGVNLLVLVKPRIARTFV